ncbi:hypothetical protein AW168_00100 [Nocardia brasiliensis]|uniref:Secreted protein n=2 Tax=Nocardia brasiliensis TaxID=37326 RepID=K0ERZ1_NOCB7|nr:hypothetical protein O3I_011480 [Nocardia brasiliensis ATCC 700358]OCF83592.1 hypothetical protein AW168_00100 [Nocardia brasiliensis]
MKRSCSVLLGVLATAGLAAGAPTASAISGTVSINGTPYADPSGCMMVGDGGPMSIENNTEGTVTVFTRADCDEGDVTGVIGAGASGTFPGKSVIVS